MTRLPNVSSRVSLKVMVGDGGRVEIRGEVDELVERMRSCLRVMVGEFCPDEFEDAWEMDLEGDEEAVTVPLAAGRPDIPILKLSPRSYRASTNSFEPTPK